MQTVRRHRGQRLKTKNILVTAKHGGGNIMVWTCFSAQGPSPFHKIDGIMNGEGYRAVLEHRMLPHAEWNMPLRWVFQHDNNPKHTSKVAKEWLTNNRIQTLDWPAQSPDLNPIENLFGILKRRVAGHRFSNKEELFNKLKTEWENLPEDCFYSLVASMPKRCEDVIKNKGGYTKY